MVSNQNFIINEIPLFNPFSLDFNTSEGWWGQEKRKCIEGCWSCGKFMPGPVYFYVNFWKIKLTKPGQKQEIIARPFLGDLEWEKGYLDQEAKGFSGFSDDDTYSSHRLLLNPNAEELIQLEPANIKETLYTKSGLLKKFVPAREYLRKIHNKSLGKPLFFNDCKNIIDIEARGGGKSYFASSLIGQNFLFDGATDYDEYLERKRTKNYFTSQTLVGAIDAKYSTDLLSKVQLGFSQFPGGVKYNGEFYPCPLLKSHKGSWMPSRSIESVRQVKVGNNWIEEGSRSTIHHRTFQDNPQAANGTRPNRVFIDEVGFHYNLRECHGAMYDTITKDYRQFGVIWYMGTGGQMASGATMEAEYIWENPDEFNCLLFNDEWEGRTKPIGYFVPKHMTLREYKDEEGVTDKTRALAIVNKIRDQKAKAKDKSILMDELQNNPEKPSEAFLVPESAYFPTFELKEHLKEIMSHTDKYIDLNYVGTLKLSLEKNKYVWEDSQDLQPIREFPLKEKLPGAFEMFESPKFTSLGGSEIIEPFRYIAGIDPYDKDDSTTNSLGSFFILDRITDRLVFEYTGRPERSNIFYENCRRALIYFNATAMYESNLTGLFTYFEQKNSLHLLADTPTQLRDHSVWKEGTNTSKGIPGTESNNKRGREYLDNWLREETKDGTENLRLHGIRSIAALKELTKWNPKENFDRVSALGMLMWYRQTLAQYTDKDEVSKIRNKKYGNYLDKFKQKPDTSRILWDKYMNPNNLVTKDINDTSKTIQPS
jgi:uncharacterized short protein YbdD (DUF466 family)